MFSSCFFTNVWKFEESSHWLLLFKSFLKNKIKVIRTDCRGYHFRIRRTNYGLGVDFRWKPSIFSIFSGSCIRQPYFLILSNGCYVPHPFVAGRRDYHFRIRRTEYGLSRKAYDGVGCERVRSRVGRSLGPTYSDSPRQMWSRYQFSLKTEHFETRPRYQFSLKTEHFGGVGHVGVVVGRRDHHFRFPHTKFSLGTDFRWKTELFLYTVIALALTKTRNEWWNQNGCQRWRNPGSFVTHMAYNRPHVYYSCHEKKSMCCPHFGPHGQHIYDVDHKVGHKVGHNVYSVGQHKWVFDQANKRRREWLERYIETL